MTFYQTRLGGSSEDARWLRDSCSHSQLSLPSSASSDATTESSSKTSTSNTKVNSNDSDQPFKRTNSCQSFPSCPTDEECLCQYSTRSDSSQHSEPATLIWSSPRKRPAPTPPRSPRSRSPIAKTLSELSMQEAHLAVEEMAAQTELLRKRLRWNFRTYLGFWHFHRVNRVVRALSKLQRELQKLENEFVIVMPCMLLDLVERVYRHFELLLREGDHVCLAVTESKSLGKMGKRLRHFAKDAALVREEAKEVRGVIVDRRKEYEKSK